MNKGLAAHWMCQQCEKSWNPTGWGEKEVGKFNLKAKSAGGKM